MENIVKAEVINFFVHEDFHFKIGKNEKDVIIPRMKFLTGGKIIQRIAEIQGRDVRSAIDVLIKVQKGGDVSVVENIENVISKLIREKNFDIIVEILELISEKVITVELINDSICQYDEVLKILSFLIDGNFSSLKNLSASLKAITSSDR
jgi:DNA polymerase III delta prime subunit